MNPRHPTRRWSFAKHLLGLAASAAVLAIAGPALSADEPLPTDLKPAQSRPAASPDSRALVLIFNAEGNDSAGSYGRSLQQSLATDLTGSGVVQGVTRKQVGEDTDSAIAAAKDSGARYVIFGQVLQVGQELRVTGQVFDTQANKAIAVLRTTGPASNYFAMQDTLGRQAVAAIAGESARDSAVPTALPPTAPAAPAAPANNYSGTTTFTPGTATITFTGTATTSQSQEYSDLYETAPTQPANTGATYYPPQAPMPPTGGYDNNYYNPWAYGGSVTNNPFVLNGNFTAVPGALGTVRVETFNSLGHSIINPPPTGSQTGSKPFSSFYTAPGSNPPIPPYAQGIKGYKNPWAPFAAPVGMPQHAAPPNLRPGQSQPLTARAAPAAARSGGGAAPSSSSGSAARGR